MKDLLNFNAIETLIDLFLGTRHFSDHLEAKRYSTKQGTEDLR